MNSFFLQMFKRGRYVSRLSSNVDESERQERERFAVAAIAFCIKHNDEFKRHFLDVVGKLPQQKIKVTLEPKLHTDLVLEGDRHVLILEFKIDAELQEHQNPENRAFWKEKGYGTKIRETFGQEVSNGKKIRYIVIGRDFDRSLCESMQSRKNERLHCSWVPWRKLLIKDRGEKKLEKDLYDCLGYLGAPAFLYRHMKTKPKNANDAKQGMAVYQFLKWVLEEKAGLMSGDADSDGKTLGLNIKRTGEGTLHRKLIDAVQPKGQNLGWIGYSTWETDCVHLAVGFYCSKEAAQKKLLKKLKAVKDLGEVTNDRFTIHVDLYREGSTDDVAWFMKVLNAAAGT